MRCIIDGIWRVLFIINIESWEYEELSKRIAITKAADFFNKYPILSLLRKKIVRFQTCWRKFFCRFVGTLILTPIWLTESQEMNFMLAPPIRAILHLSSLWHAE